MVGQSQSESTSIAFQNNHRSVRRERTLVPDQAAKRDFDTALNGYLEAIQQKKAALLAAVNRPSRAKTRMKLMLPSSLTKLYTQL